MEMIKSPVTYSVTTEYNKYDTVSYTVDNSLEYFLCISNNTPIGTLPTNTSYFIQLTLKGDKGASGTGMSPRGGWLGATQYYANDCVAHNGVLWYATVDNYGSEPTDTNTNWVSFMSYHVQIIQSSTQPTGQSTGDYWYEIIG